MTSKTKAIVAVHLYCSTADLDALIEITEAQGLALIEDAAQAHGCLWRGKQVGGFGTAGIFSFNQKKLMACGEGGCMITDDTDVYQQAYALRDLDSRPTYFPLLRCGTNKQISTICAAILCAQLERLPHIAAREADKARFLHERLADVPGIAFPRIRSQVTQPSYYSFCIRLVHEQLQVKRPQILGDLTHALSVKFSPAYPPLDDATLFRPSLEKRYEGLWRFDTEALHGCHQASRETIRFSHYWLLAENDELERIAAEIQAVVRRYI